MAEDQSIDNPEESLSYYEEITRALRAATNELRTQKSLNGQIVQDFSNYQKLADKVLNDQEGITNLTEKDLSKLIEKQKVLLQELKTKAASLDISKDTGEAVKALKEAEKENFILQQEALDAAEKYLENKLELNKALGISGTLLKASKGVLDKIGLSALNNVISFDKANEKMREQAERIKEAGGELNTFSTKLKVGFTGAKSVLGDVVKNLKDPLVIIGAMTVGWLKINQASTDYNRTTGLAANNISEGFDSLVTTADQYRVLGELSKEFGINAGIAFSSEQTKDVTFLVDRMGLTARQAGRIAQFSKQSNLSIKATTDSIIKQTKQFAIQNGLNINAKELLTDIASTSSATVLSLGNQSSKISQANLEARKLGLTLQQVEGITDSLLDFQSSIASELEAELLTGKQINLEQARYYALTNDLAGVSKEIGKNQEVINTFSSSNRIAQESIAKSLGMSREDMAKMILTSNMQGGLNEQQKKQLEGISGETMSQLSAQDSIAKVMEKITSFAGVLAGWILKVLENSYLLIPTLTIIGAILLPKMVKSIWGGVKGTIELVKNVGKYLALKKAAQKIEETSEGLTPGDSINKKVKTPKGGEGSSKIIDGVTNSFEKLGKAKSNIKQGAIVLGIIGLAMIPFATAIWLMKGVDPSVILSFGLVVGGLVAIMLLLGNPITLAATGFGAIALAILGATIVGLGFAFASATKSSKNMKEFADALLTLTSPRIMDGLMGFPLVGQKVSEGLNTISDSSSKFSITALESLSRLGPNLQTVGKSLNNIADGLIRISNSLVTLDTKKLKEIAEIAEDNALDGFANKIASSVAKPLETISNNTSGNKNKELKEIKNLLSQILKKEGTIKLDSTKLGTAIGMKTYRIQ